MFSLSFTPEIRLTFEIATHDTTKQSNAPAIIDYANPSLSLCMNGRNGFAPVTASRR
jgi:hypothetical protein